MLVPPKNCLVWEKYGECLPADIHRMLMKEVINITYKPSSWHSWLFHKEIRLRWIVSLNASLWFSFRIQDDVFVGASHFAISLHSGTNVSRPMPLLVPDSGEKNRFQFEFSTHTKYLCFFALIIIYNDEVKTIRPIPKSWLKANHA